MSGHNVERHGSAAWLAPGGLAGGGGRVRGGEWQASDQNEAGRHLHREQAATPKNTKLEYETEPR